MEFETNSGSHTGHERTEKQYTESSQQPKVPTKPRCLTKVELRLLDYVDGFDRNLMCPICHGPFIDAVRIPCDHAFCRECLFEALHTQSQDRKTCPSCREVTSQEQAVPVPRFVRHMVDDLMVKCPKNSIGCDNEMRRGDVKNHIQFYCDFADVACASTDCSQAVRRKDYCQRCLHEQVSCKHCRVQLPELHLEDHMENHCTVALSSCAFCQKLCVKAKLRGHADVCSEAIVACPAAAIGCRLRCKRGHLDEHIEQCPLAAVQPTLKLMNSRISEQDTALSALRHRSDFYEARFDAMHEVLDGSLPIPPPVPARGGNLPSLQANLAPLSNQEGNTTQIDNATHQLLSMQESLREELGRVVDSVTELDARTSVTIINENLRLKEDISRMNGAIGAMRMQMQWLMSARMNFQSRGTVSASAPVGANHGAESIQGPGAGTRRSSDSSRQDTKL